MLRPVPLRFAIIPTISGWYNYDASTCHARTMASCARTSMLMNKRRFSKNIRIDFFGGGTRSEGTRRIAVSAKSGSLFRKPRLIEMDLLKKEETLHNYLRRHFERISEKKARQLAEQDGVLKDDVALDTHRPKQ